MTAHTVLERYRRIHRPGQDCRVTSGRNILELYGYKHSYATVQGLSSNFFFSYRTAFSPLEQLTFAGGDVCAHYWPVSGQRIEVLENLAYLYNAELVTGVDQSPAAAQAALFAFLDQGIPVLVAVSRQALGRLLGQPLRFPPCLGNLQFGGHFVTVVGYDRQRATVQLFDTDHGHLLELPLAVLAEARIEGDHTAECIMQSRNRWAVFLPGSSVPPLAHRIRAALERTVHLWLGAGADDGGAAGLHGMRRLCAELPGWSERRDLPADKLKATAYVLHMSSEKIAGGGLGRRCFGMFLRQAGDALGSPMLHEAAGDYAVLAQLWRQLMTAVDTCVFDPAGPRSLDQPAIRALLAELLEREEQGFDRLQAGLREAA
jgi:hypothetical protein